MHDCSEESVIEQSAIYPLGHLELPAVSCALLVRGGVWYTASNTSANDAAGCEALHDSPTDSQ